ncbi:MAG: flagellar basal body L-ring protein FlgH [Pseudomonadota bacterium]
MIVTLLKSRRLAVALLLSLLTACASPLPDVPEPGDPRYAPVMTPVATARRTPTGSIYHAGQAVDLYQRRAYRLGDVLTINLNESTSASKSSGTTYNRDSGAQVGELSVLGQSVDTRTGLDSNVEFEGASNADQSNQLQGNISVTVADVKPNGLLEVRGEKWLQLNHGAEFIRISGLVRPQDILPDNSIDSTRVADVRIAYSGTGTLASADEPGWLSRFFVSTLWPF